MSPSSPEEVSVSVCTVAFPAVATGHFMLKVKDYSRLKATAHGNNGSYIESSAFKVGDHSWTIHCYLNGDSEKAAGFVSLYLHLCNAGTGPVVHAEYELALVPPPPAYGRRRRRQGTLSKASERVRAFGDGGKVNYYSSNWGRPYFISVKELEQSRFLKNDCFAVRCTVTVVEERTTVEEKVVVPAHDMERMIGVVCK